MSILEINEKRYLPKFYKSNHSIWVIVLSEYKRTTDTFSGIINNRPSQFHANQGTNTLLLQTWKQAQEITNDPHILTVSVEKNKPYFNTLGKHNIPGKLIYQPEQHGSAAAIFLALTFILAKDPQAQVVILPLDDYYKNPEKKITPYINRISEELVHNPYKAILLAEDPTSLIDKNEHQHQWIDINITSTQTDDTFLPINRLHSKTRVSTAMKRSKNSALRSTGVIISKANLLWKLCMNTLPDLFEKMEYVHQVILHFKGDRVGDDYIKMAISHSFYHLPSYHFCKDLINKCLSQCQAFNIKNQTSEPLAKQVSHLESSELALSY
jgi:mannose-1-phosphate guanylyltransferase